MTAQDGDLLHVLQDVLNAEYAAVYGYGLVGGRLSGADVETAAAAFMAHENRRDAVRRLVLDHGGMPVAALPAYRPKAPVVDRRSAVLLAIALEEDCAATYIAVVSATDDRSLRSSAVGWLTDAAVRDELWRARLGAATLAANPALPGLITPPSSASPTPSAS